MSPGFSKTTHSRSHDVPGSILSVAIPHLHMRWIMADMDIESLYYWLGDPARKGCNAAAADVQQISTQRFGSDIGHFV